QRQSGNLRAVSRHLKQDGRGLQIEIVNVVVDCLEVPLPFSRQSIECDQSIAVETGPWPITAKKVRSRRTVRQIDESQIRIKAEKAPHVYARASLPAVFAPRFVTEFSRPGNSVK